MAEDQAETRILFKIQPETHLYCKKSARQNVRQAAQLLSQTTAKAFTFVFGEEMGTQAEAVQTVNDWFDVMNSRQVYDKKVLGCAYGIHQKQQEDALMKMETLIKTMKINKKTKLLPFQKGILMSIKSIQSLFHVLNSSHNISFIFTSHVNQDNLENLFSRLRALNSNYQHPSPVEALRRLRILMIGQNHDLAVKNSSVAIAVETQTSDNEQVLRDSENIRSFDTEEDDCSTDIDALSKSLTSSIPDPILLEHEEVLVSDEIIDDIES